MRHLIMGGGPFDDAEKASILDYCQSDVEALCELWELMGTGIDLPHALIRGRYGAAVAKMEREGVPIDVELFKRLTRNWDHFQDSFIARFDRWNLYEGRTFKETRFAHRLRVQGLSWPRTATGRLALNDDTFKERALAYPELADIRALRKTLNTMKSVKLSVGGDGRNRTSVRPFCSKTGRNQPSNVKQIFGLPSWLRGLVTPREGRALAYIDYAQQEFGIAAALSGDVAMLRAYSSGDPYLTFAIQAGAAPPDATKLTHKVVRDRFKATTLAVQYAMGAEGLAARLNVCVPTATELLSLHRRTYSTFWKWSDAVVNQAFLMGQLESVFGWKMRVSSASNPRSVRNFPMQANGAEILRLACSMGTEHGVRICAPVHDAVLIEGDAEGINEIVGEMIGYMKEASRIVLGGLELSCDVKVLHFGERLLEYRSRQMFEQVIEMLRAMSGEHDLPLVGGLSP